MSTYIDKKYIGMVSPLLKRFKWKKDNLANCRCPICGICCVLDKGIKQ